MPTQTTLYPTMSQSASLLPKQHMRQEGAASAQNFAQIMQSFHGGSEIAQSTTQTQDASDKELQQDQLDQAAQSDETVTQGDQGTDDSTSEVSKTEQDQTVDANPDADSSPSANQDSDQSAPLNEQQKPHDEQSVESDEPEAPFRQLQFQGDHARFTIKGIDRQLTHAADINIAADAKALGTLNHQVATAKGGEQAQTDSESAQTNIPNRQSNEPKPEAGSAFTRTQQESIDSASTRQRSAQARSELDQSRPVHQTQTQPQPTVGLGDLVLTSENPQRHEVQVVRSQQSDVAQIAGLSARSNSTSQVNADITSATSRSPLQEIPGLTTRAIAGVGSGQGTSQQGIGSGSLAQKMQSAELPSETKRAGVLAQVQRGLASMLRSGKSEMTLRLTPGHLGEIKVNVKSDGDQVTIRFETTTREAADYLKSSADELGTNLKTKGVEVQHIKIETAEQQHAGTSFDGTGSSHSENESNNPQRREDQSNQQPTQTRASEHDSDEPDNGQGVWTELGLDAIA